MRKRRTIIRDPLTGRRRVATANEVRLAGIVAHKEWFIDELSGIIAAKDRQIVEMGREVDIREELIERTARQFAPHLKPHIETMARMMEKANGRKAFVSMRRDMIFKATPIRRHTVQIPDITFCYDEVTI